MADADFSVGPPPRTEVQDPGASAPIDDVDLVAVPEVDESIVRGLLKGIGGLANTIVGEEEVPDHWRFTEAELDALVPPLTRVINRRPKWRAAVIRGDEATVVLVLAGYAGRNVELAKKARENDEQPREAGPAQGNAGAGARGPDVAAAGYAGGGGGLRPAAAGSGN